MHDVDKMLRSYSGVRPGRRVHVQQEGPRAREEAGRWQGAALPVPGRSLSVHQEATLRRRRLGQQLRVPADTALLRPAPDGADVAAGCAIDPARPATRWQPVHPLSSCPPRRLLPYMQRRESARATLGALPALHRAIP